MVHIIININLSLYAKIHQVGFHREKQSKHEQIKEFFYKVLYNILL